MSKELSRCGLCCMSYNPGIFDGDLSPVQPCSKLYLDQKNPFCTIFKQSDFPKACWNYNCRCDRQLNLALTLCIITPDTTEDLFTYLTDNPQILNYHPLVECFNKGIPITGQTIFDLNNLYEMNPYHFARLAQGLGLIEYAAHHPRLFNTSVEQNRIHLQTFPERKLVVEQNLNTVYALRREYERLKSA